MRTCGPYVIGKMVLKPGLAGLGRIEVHPARFSGLAESGILVIQSLAAFMTKNTLPALTAFLLAAIGPALAQDLPPYQSLETRHVCTAQPIHETPAGTQARVLGAGAEVMLRDVTFGPEGGAWFALDYPTGKGLERAIGYLPVSSVKHFCAPEGAAPEDSTSRLQSYLAPPNTCHVVAARADTVEELNGQARSMPAYAPVISGYRLHSGGYALSLGLVSTNLRDRIGSPAARLQTGITCVSGADFAEALVHDGTVLTPADPGGLSDDAARLSTAQALRARGLESGDPAMLKRSCDLGLGAACTEFASRIHDAPDGPGRGPAVVTRYALLGCMAGDMEGCQMAINRQGNTLELTREQVLPDARPDDGSVTTEISKGLCDAQDRFGCVLLARGTAVDRAPSLVEASSNFSANLTACQQGITWICEGLNDDLKTVSAARGSGLTGNERYALAGIEAGLCAPGPREPNQRSCTGAYYLYRDFLNYSDAATLDAGRVAQATAFLSSGCAAGDPPACATLAGMAGFWPEADRRAATARAIALCDAQSAKDTICESLGGVLDPTFPESRPVMAARYERLARSCLSPGEGDAQDCAWALHSYAALDAPDGLATAEAMLKDACGPANIKGCPALAQLYGTEGQSLSGVTIPGRNDPEARIAALRMGCRGGVEAGSTCDQLADLMTVEGDGENALHIRGEACERAIAAGEERDLWECYDAAKQALDQSQRLPGAHRWADYVCRGADVSVSPYGCKLVGNMLAQGLGQPADPAGALSAYQRGCFHPRVATTDGEACLHYGTMLIEAVRRGEKPAEPLAFAHREDGEEPEPPLMLAEASRAFDMGCLDSIAPACAANVRLLEEWSTGDLPYDRFICQVRNAAGEVTSEKPCRGLIFYQAAEARKETREQVGLNVYVWPDGDRSVTYIRDGIWRLNEVRTDYPATEGNSRCWRNPISTRSFCVTPAG
ncbi:TPR repeat [Paracoccus denitrificans]|uniref:Uncharacterized protein n=4 Tax=Paracoccus denitrificans TaxID=266 RepID=A1B7G9_PARDP|nr:hypothetical protein Pden_3390 [Paracoccus denitrificans PD1222]SDJ47999.1 TPR repeat [Paracoccus denitrificans]SFR18948.1 TPR repeat [Paracoccus denitrificans]